MAKERDYSYLLNENYDIFLCTRGLPDALTPETAALRQLMSALVGSGYKVFFPSALPKDVPEEILARAMADAVRGSKVMIAAAVGDEGAQDPTARFLWKRFRELSAAEPERRFIACARDLSQLPEELEGAQTLDMGALRFLSDLSGLLSQTLPRREAEPAAETEAEAEPEAEEVREDAEPEEAAPEEAAPEEEAPEEEAPEEEAPEEPVSPEDPEPTPPNKRRRKLFLALAIAVGVLAVLGLALLFFAR